jgi:hypothetical protein
VSDALQPRCPVCKTLLKQIASRPGEEEWLCPIALEAQRKGILGEPGRKHKEVLIYTKKEK